MNTKLIAGSIIIAGIIVAGAVIYQPSNKPFYTGTTTDATPAAAPNPLALSTDDDAVLGNPSAPVTIVEFGDYQCPFCKQLFDTVEPQLRKDYVDTGKVKMVYRDFPLDSIHPYARPAAEAAQCAQPQGKYWQYHDALFARQNQLATLDYVKLAGELGLDTTQFKTCLDGHVYANEIEKDRKDGETLGVQGTPATFINGKLIPGAYPYEAFKAEIDRALAQ